MLDDLRHKHHILNDFPCLHALQETDNWTTSAMNVPGFFNVSDSDYGRTAILRPREVNHFRRSWADRERCTAIMVGSTMLLSVMRHSGRDRLDYIEALETVRVTLTEGRKAGAVGR